MRTTVAPARWFTVALLVFTVSLPLWARPRTPWPPLPELTPVLHRERFDEPFWSGNTDSRLLVPGLGTLVESWSGYALERAGAVTPFVLSGLGPGGQTNIASVGALRFWFRPYWSSAPLGRGPGTSACLLELGASDGKSWLGLWRLETSPEGDVLALVRWDDAGPQALIKTALQWRAGEWHQVAVNYGPKATALFVDGQRVGDGPGVATLPPAALLLVWGSDVEGQASVQGDLDELYTFSKALEVGLQYATLRDQAALGPVSDQEERKLAEWQAKWAEAASEQDGGPGQMRPLGSTTECYTNVPVYLTNVVALYRTNSGWTVEFDLQGGPAGVYWDIFATTHLAANHVTNAQWFWLERGPSCSRYQYTNQSGGWAFYIVGATNDSDGGGLSDAYERLVTHTDPNDSADDRLLPLVSLYVTDSVALEQFPTNTARFLLRRLGGLMQQPLTVGCQVSGTASNGLDYALYGVTATPSNVLVTFGPGESVREITVVAYPDSVAEGSETVTLTLSSNVQPCELDGAHSSATAWILESYVKVFTSVMDFGEGLMAGLEAVGSSPTHTNGRLQFRTNLPPQFPFIAVACSGRGTVARINTTNGQVLGEYRTTPAGLQYTGDSGQGPQPSRTTVDLFGNVWVANRADDRAAGGRTNGSITRIGLIVGGTRHSKSNGVYYPDPNGQYVSLSDALYNTCLDRDGDGFIRTSRGLADILPWTNQRDGRVDVDSDGGVSTAEDEAITEYVRVPSTGTRTIAVDKWNDIWVGGYRNEHYHLKVNGLTAEVVPGSVFSPTNQYGVPYGGYGGVIDRLGQLWSSESSGDTLLRLRPSTNAPPLPNTDWALLTAPGVNMYGIAVDPLHPYVWQTTGGSNVFRWHTNGTPVTNADGTVRLHNHGHGLSQGLVVDTNGHVWVAHHKDGGTTVGHLNTNGTWLGNVTLRLPRLRGEYFANTNLAGPPSLTRADAPIDFDWGQGAPDPRLPTNFFSVRWSGTLSNPTDGTITFFVAADAGAGVRLVVDSTTVLDTWENSPTNAVELVASNYFAAGERPIRLDYKETTGEARIRLSWIEPGTTNKVVIPAERLRGPINVGPTGVAVDAAGCIWATCFHANRAVRINPTAGPLVVADGLTNHVGEVDLEVDLGDGSYHQEPYTNAATPYNYSDMTGFNNRIVNPTGQPFKGSWTVIHDSGLWGLWWQRVSWTDNLPIAGCGIEVWARASDDRAALANEPFMAISNGATLSGLKGRYIEVRVGLMRDDPSKQPALYDLTLWGSSSSYEGELFLDDAWAQETQTAWFFVLLDGPQPVTYRWSVRYPWSQLFEPLAGVNNWYLAWTNADPWEDWSQVRLSVSNAAGETLELGPATLWVYPMPITLPGSATNTMGPASRYPATIHVRGEPSNGLSRVEVVLRNLRHAYPADLDILLVSPSGAKIMLMSDAGSSFAVTNATLVFHPASQWPGWPSPPETGPIPSGQTSHYSPYNYGAPEETQLPGGAPEGPYNGTLDHLPITDSNPNGLWRLYIYDDKAGQAGEVHGSWRLEFFYE